MKQPGIKKFKLSQLKAAEYNPRVISDEALEGLTNSIKRFGCVEPIVVNIKGGANTIIGGHQRFAALKRLGVKDVICVTISCTKAEEKLLNLSLNNPEIQGDFIEKISEYVTQLKKEIGDNQAILDLRINELIGEIEAENEGLTDDDAVPEVPEKPKTKKGDLYILGEHRLLCGDSTKAEDVERLMDGKKADMVFTDPPYGIDLNTDWSSAKSKLKFYKEKGCRGQGNKYSKVIGDNKRFKIEELLKKFDYIKEQFYWGAENYLKGKSCGSWFVWDKRIDTTMDKMYGSCFELCWSLKKHKREIARIRWAGIFGTEKEPDSDKSRKHPTQKPVELCLWFFKKFKGNIILDPFLGSGSTMIACEKLGRRCFGMEIDEHYCDVIVKRWEDFTGKKAILHRPKQAKKGTIGRKSKKNRPQAAVAANSGNIKEV